MMMNGNEGEGAPPLVLVVDDDPNIRLLVCQCLEPDGFVVGEAENGEQALSIYSTFQPDIVLLDVVMPGRDGFTVCREIRGQPGSERIPVLMMTSLDDEESVNRAYEAGATDFITKPIKWSLLSHRLRYMLRASRTTVSLGESEARHRALLNAIPDLLLRLDEEGRIFDYKGAKGFTLLPGDVSPVGQTLSDVLPDGLAGMLQDRIRAGPRSMCEQALEYEHVTAGDTSHYEAHLVRSGEEEFICLVRDISERKRAETERRRLEGQLRQSQKMEAIGTLAGGIAHDFNNILAAIIGYAELALLDVQEESVQQTNLQEILQGGMRARGLVQQILAFSRQSEPEDAPVQVHLLVKEVLQLLRASLPSTIEIRPDIRANNGMVAADPTEIHQVLMNLCTNALHAMNEKGGVLEVALTEEMLEPGERALHPELLPGSYLRLTVRDTGHGMGKRVRERIFDPFFTTKGPGKGTGMGLSVVHGIVKRCKGAIRVDTELGKGTTFEILLPTVDRQVKQECGRGESLREGRGHVLFVDDERAIVDMTRKVLERIGYQVTAGTSSEEALEAFRADPYGYDIVITDLTMPSLTGMELSQEVHRLRPDVPILLCTGFSEAIDHETVREVGIREILLKPIPTRNLADAVHRALSRTEKTTGPIASRIEVVDDDSRNIRRGRSR